MTSVVKELTKERRPLDEDYLPWRLGRDEHTNFTWNQPVVVIKDPGHNGRASGRLYISLPEIGDIGNYRETQYFCTEFFVRRKIFS